MKRRRHAVPDMAERVGSIHAALADLRTLDAVPCLLAAIDVVIETDKQNADIVWKWIAELVDDRRNYLRNAAPKGQA